MSKSSQESLDMILEVIKRNVDKNNVWIHDGSIRDELASQTQLSLRTVERYLAALKSLGVATFSETPTGRNSGKYARVSTLTLLLPNAHIKKAASGFFEVTPG